MSRLTEQEAINILQLNTPFVASKETNQAVDMAIDALEKQSMVNEILNEAEQYKLALFGVIRNSKVMPVGLAQGRSMEEINAMALKTMEEVLKMCDFDKMKQFYSEAESALAKMGGK
jgi:hypothetical protein